LAWLLIVAVNLSWNREELCRQVADSALELQAVVGNPPTAPHLALLELRREDKVIFSYWLQYLTPLTCQLHMACANGKDGYPKR